MAEAAQVYSNFGEIIASNSFNAVLSASLVLIILVGVAFLIKKPAEVLKRLLFTLICIITILTTVYLASLTVYLNNVSASKGPVHYHADLEIWGCGREYDLINPTGWSNKIGTPTLHEHNDKRIHLEGVIVEKQDASLGKFFKVIGGQISTQRLAFPSTMGQATFASGQSCPDGVPATLQVFVYKVVQGTAVQTKVSNPAEYIISPESQIPPGDCIIVEFDKNKDLTDKQCRSFKVAKELGKIK